MFYYLVTKRIKLYSKLEKNAESLKLISHFYRNFLSSKKFLYVLVYYDLCTSCTNCH